jgi:hypothetical protein
MIFAVYGAIKEDDENGLYVFGSHQYALYYWVRALLAQQISPNAQLIHIDYHTDFLQPSVAIDSAATPTSIKQLIECGKLRNDQFIKAAMMLNIINNISFCCPPLPHQPCGDFRNYSSPTVLVGELNKYLSSKDMQSCQPQDELFPQLNKGNILLNIDLDFFYEVKERGKMEPKPEIDIARDVIAINSLLKYATITTIAMSPELNRKAYKKIAVMFSKYFALPIDFEMPMPVYGIGCDK